jgi:hypothetical protein
MRWGRKLTRSYGEKTRISSSSRGLRVASLTRCACPSLFYRCRLKLVDEEGPREPVRLLAGVAGRSREAVVESLLVVFTVNREQQVVASVGKRGTGGSCCSASSLSLQLSLELVSETHKISEGS